MPGIIGLTTHGFPEVPIVNDIARSCRRLWPNAAVVIGGGQATVTPELFDRDSVDVIVRGPGERVWRELCRTGVTVGPTRVLTDPIHRASTHIRCPIAALQRSIVTATRRGFLITVGAVGTRRPHGLHAAHARLPVQVQLLRDLARQLTKRPYELSCCGSRPFFPFAPRFKNSISTP